MTFTPTHVNDTPAVCHCCGRTPTGIGIGLTTPREDPKYLCRECLMLVEQIQRVRRFDPYEKEARRGGMDAAGPLVEEFGSDLSEWTEDQIMIFCGAIWRGCGDRLRELVASKETPF